MLDSSKENLESYKILIREFLKFIKLELHSEKSKVISLHEGVKFLGFRIFYKYKLLKRSNIRKMNHRIENFVDLYMSRIIKKNEIHERIDGWFAYAMHADTYRFRKYTMKRLQKSIKEIDNESTLPVF